MSTGNDTANEDLRYSVPYTLDQVLDDYEANCISVEREGEAYNAATLDLQAKNIAFAEATVARDEADYVHSAIRRAGNQLLEIHNLQWPRRQRISELEDKAIPEAAKKRDRALVISLARELKCLKAQVKQTHEQAVKIHTEAVALVGLEPRRHENEFYQIDQAKGFAISRREAAVRAAGQCKVAKEVANNHHKAMIEAYQREAALQRSAGTALISAALAAVDEEDAKNSVDKS